jgi:hypothetical protein
VFRYEVSRSGITVQREVRARFKEDAPHKNNVFLHRARNSRCTVITVLDTSKRSTRKAVLLRRNIAKWSRGQAVRTRSELLVAHEKLEQILLLTVINSLLNFKTVPFFCVCSVNSFSFVLCCLMPFRILLLLLLLLSSTASVV